MMRFDNWSKKELKSALKVLMDARQLLKERQWTQRLEAAVVDEGKGVRITISDHDHYKEGNAFCALGAIKAADGAKPPLVYLAPLAFAIDRTLKRSIQEEMKETREWYESDMPEGDIREKLTDAITAFNDADDTEKRDVIRKFNRAIQNVQDRLRRRG